MRRFINDFYEPICIYILCAWLVRCIKYPVFLIYLFAAFGIIMAIMISGSILSLHYKSIISPPNNFDAIVVVSSLISSCISIYISEARPSFFQIGILLMMFGIGRLISIIIFIKEGEYIEIREYKRY